MSGHIAKQIATTLAAFPDLNTSANDAARAYVLAIDGIPPEHVTEALKRFLQGKVAGYNPAFRPTPPQVATEAKRLWDLAIATERRKAPALPEPDVEIPPEVRERRAKQLADLSKRLGGNLSTA